MSTSPNIAQVAALSGDNTKGVSLCIPRVFANIGWRRIKRVFIALNWGYVERVDVIPSGGTKRAFIHFAPDKFTANGVLTALREGKQVKVVYDDPWYWNISLSRSPKPEEAPKPKARPKIEIADAPTVPVPALTRQTADMGLADMETIETENAGEESKHAHEDAGMSGAAALAAGVYDTSLQPDEEQRGSSSD